MIAFVTGARLRRGRQPLCALREFVSPDLFNFSYVTIMLIMVILAERNLDRLRSCGDLHLPPELLREAYRRMIIFAGILIITTLFMPKRSFFR